MIEVASAIVGVVHFASSLIGVLVGILLFCFVYRKELK